MRSLSAPRWGALRVLLTLGDVPDDYLVQFDQHAKEIRLLQPPEPAYGPTAPIEDLELAPRSYNILKRQGIDTIGELRRLSPEAILRFRNADMNVVEDCQTKLAAAGLRWPSAEN